MAGWVQTQFAIAIHLIRGASWEALVLKEGQDMVAGSLSISAHVATKQPRDLDPQGLLTGFP